MVPGIKEQNRQSAICFQWKQKHNTVYAISKITTRIIKGFNRKEHQLFLRYNKLLTK